MRVLPRFWCSSRRKNLLSQAFLASLWWVQVKIVLTVKTLYVQEGYKCLILAEGAQKVGEFSCYFSNPPAQRLTTLVSHSEANPKNSWMRGEQACLITLTTYRWHLLQRSKNLKQLKCILELGLTTMTDRQCHTKDSIRTRFGLTNDQYQTLIVLYPTSSLGFAILASFMYKSNTGCAEIVFVTVREAFKKVLADFVR